MKGKSKFTLNEISNIEKLIEEKLKNPAEKQKGIRNKIRKMGFYWEDFHPKNEGPKIEYNVENFRKLIAEGHIVIIASKETGFINSSEQNTISQSNYQNKLLKKGLDPWVGKSPKVLILGTMPGDESISQQMYYANTSHNSFWKIMYSLFPKKENQNNKDFITSHGIALWDCVYSGIRTGSTDLGFDDKTIIPNDLKSFLNQYPTIKTIVLNGKNKTMDYYKKFFSDVKIGKIIILNSTSNTCSKPFEIKKEEWSIIKELIK